MNSLNPLVNPALTHPILPEINFAHPFEGRPVLATLPIQLVDLLDDWCKKNDSILIPGYEGPCSDGIGVAFLIPEDQHVRLFVDHLFNFMEDAMPYYGNIIDEMRRTFLTVANKGHYLVFPRLLVTL